MLALALVLLAVRPASADIALKDVTGREVKLAAPAKRLLIDDGRFLIALSLIHPDPVSVLAAWPRDINRIGKRTFEAYKAKFPAIETASPRWRARPVRCRSSRWWRPSPTSPCSRSARSPPTRSARASRRPASRWW